MDKKLQKYNLNIAEDTLASKEYYLSLSKEELYKTITVQHMSIKRQQEMILKEREVNDHLQRKLAFHGLEQPHIDKLAKMIKEKYKADIP